MKRTDKKIKRVRTDHKKFVRTAFPRIYYVQKTGDQIYFKKIYRDGRYKISQKPILMTQIEAGNLKAKIEQKLYVPLKISHV